MSATNSSYDIIVIGAGSGGLGMSGVTNAIGLKTLLIEKEARNIGGDCLNYGCIPSKSLIHISKHFRGAHEATAFGLIHKGNADIGKVLAYVHNKQEYIRHHENETYLREQGIDVVIGQARFSGPNTIEVGGHSYTARRIVMATGSRPRHIPIEGLDQVEWYNNESLFYEMKTLPDRFLILGGGPIGCEMAQAFQRFGSKVVIVNTGERILGIERKEMSEVLSKRFKSEGIEIHNSSKLLNFVGTNLGVVERSDGHQFTVEFDAVLLAIGRVINVEGMGLETAGIKVERGKIVVDQYLQTTNKRVYAVGDAAGKYKFSHGAEKHVRQLARNFFLPFRKKHHVKDLSWVTFTDPEIATFGLTEKHLKENNIKYWRQDQNFSGDDRAITSSYEDGRVSLFLTPKRFWKKQRILGGSMIAPNAGEIIQELLLATNAKLPVKDLFNKVYPYPTASRINQQTIRGLRVDSLTPSLKRLLRTLYRWLA